MTKEQADRLDSYDVLSFEKPYLDSLYDDTGNLLNERMGRAVMRLAALWNYCWEQAGRPKLP